MSDHEGGVGAFMLGVALGALLGLVFAPGPGDETRTKLARRMRNLRDLAEETVDDVRALVAGEDEADASESEDEVDADDVTAETEVRQQLSEARRRRRNARAEQRAPSDEEDDSVA